MVGLVAAAVATVVVAGALGAGSAGAAAARDRALADLPDDIAGPQVHFLYVVPADGADRQLDTNGEMDQSITRVERWFVDQGVEQALRVDTYRGAPDISFVRLPLSDAQAAAPFDIGPLLIIGQYLAAAGFNNPAKAYAVMYDGHGSLTCGRATARAPQKLGAAYLLGGTAAGTQICRDVRGYGPGTDRAGFFEIVLLHEIMHTIGYSPRCAPHASRSEFPDHVNDSPQDLMYGPDPAHLAPWDWAHAVLDVNHDDYYRASVPGCYDLSASPYLAQVPSFNLSVTTRGRGSVDTFIGNANPRPCRTVCTFSALRSSLVTLSATPAAAFRFVGWSDGCSGKSDCKLTMNGATSVTATFAAKPKPTCRKGQKSTKKRPCVKRRRA